ncbi:hypothetical protein PanWU01x14_210670 [Parasponia andersonii]|uniref:Uncharacterized protein n=1 Tax=Parasponia andersonii TaxID=3476 RepID=A0A2P5BTX2_PARAD|nr:hypothetical protein PanWU01x14_210670 [Parasponia andersonii]
MDHELRHLQVSAERMTILYAPPLGSDILGEIRGYEKASADVAVKFHPIYKKKKPSVLL